MAGSELYLGRTVYLNLEAPTERSGFDLVISGKERRLLVELDEILELTNLGFEEEESGGVVMRNFQAHGRFLKRGVHFYRTAAHLQWGHSAISLGFCLLLNPGSATLERTAPDLYKQLLVNGEAYGQVTPDPTMDQLAAFLEGVYGQAIEGRFTIYNLFWLQNTDDQDAIEQFVSMVEQKVFEFDESLVDIDELQQHPWILIGWGVKKHKRHWIPLVQIKERWTSLIRISSVPYFGKPHPKQQSGYYYYHPCPRILNLRPLIIDDLQKLFNRNIQHLLNK